MVVSKGVTTRLPLKIHSIPYFSSISIALVYDKKKNRFGGPFVETTMNELIII